jgi:cytochrome c oxidase cbb3-type subunit 2
LWSGSLLTGADAQALTNSERLPVFVMMTCLNGYFDDPVLDRTLLQGSALARTVRLIVPAPDTVALVRYLQKLGMSRGAWRDAFESQTVAVSALRVPESDASRALGREVYRDHCVGCHGEHGDGAGPAATFLFPRPRDFTTAVFKFQSTPSGTLPTDGDLYRTITRGVRGTAMPTSHEVSERERLAVVAYIKTLSSRWRAETPPTPLPVSAPPPATTELLARGRQLFAQAKCAECHGEEGRGDQDAVQHRLSSDPDFLRDGALGVFDEIHRTQQR